MTRVDGSVPSPSDPAVLSLNQVHHDDIPMPMPDGVAPPFAWTLQPGGATFDPPIQIEYPNMTGLPAGSVSYFLSFNHDTNRFEIVASGTVSADGSTIITDPGSGLTVAGWGCNCPPYSVTGTCINCITNCIDIGSLSTGVGEADESAICIGESVTFSVTEDSEDSGGTKVIICPEGSTMVPDGPVAPIYSWVISGPGGFFSGKGASVTFAPPGIGTYNCTFTATAKRDCAPSPVSFSGGSVTVFEVDSITVEEPKQCVILGGNMFNFSATTNPADGEDLIVWDAPGGAPDFDTGSTFTTTFVDDGVISTVAASTFGPRTFPGTYNVTASCGSSLFQEVDAIEVASLNVAGAIKIDEGFQDVDGDGMDDDFVDFDNDGEDDTATWVICVNKINPNATTTAISNPRIPEDQLPDCWAFSGEGTNPIGSGKIQRSIPLGLPQTFSLVVESGASRKVATVYVINVDVGFMGLNEVTEENPGGFICLNDNDNAGGLTAGEGNGIVDISDPTPLPHHPDNDLQAISLAIFPNPGIGTVELVVPGTLKVWKDKMKTATPTSWDLTATSLPTTLFIEGFATGAADLLIRYNDAAPPCEDKVKITSQKVEFVQYQLNGIWFDVPSGGFADICKGSSITFKAIPAPSGISWPSGQPVWGGDASSTGEITTVTFSNSGNRIVTVGCGSPEISIPVVVDDEDTTTPITWDSVDYSVFDNDDSSGFDAKPFNIEYLACADIGNNRWELRVDEIIGDGAITVYTGGSRDPFSNLPISEIEAQDAVNVMKSYHTNGFRGDWHTEAASRAHEEYHYDEWQCSSEHYWSITETAIENITAPYDEFPSEPTAILIMRIGTDGADAKIFPFFSISRVYTDLLCDMAGCEPRKAFSAGQLELNAAIQFVQNLAVEKGWTVDQSIDTPSTENPCYIKPFPPFSP